MTPRPNPLKLNPLQARTLAVLQQLARANGGKIVRTDLAAHGNHVHVGDAVVMTKDMTGLANPAVFAALIRKGLVGQHNAAMCHATLTEDGLAYDVGPQARAILHRSDH